MSKKKDKKKGGGRNDVTKNKTTTASMMEPTITENNESSLLVLAQNSSELPPTSIVTRIRKGWPDCSSRKSFEVWYLVFSVIGIVLSIFSNKGINGIGDILGASLIPLIFFPLFAYERGSLSEDEKELRDNMFPAYSFVISMIISIMFGIGGSNTIKVWNISNLSFALFISLLFWEGLLFIKLAEKDKIALKKRKNHQLTLIANGETFTLMDKDGKPICLPLPGEKERETD